MAGHEVIIRDVTPADEVAIARMWQALTAYHVALDPRLPDATPGAAERYAERLIERRDDPHTHAFVAEVNGAAVGYILGAIIDLHPDLFRHVESGFIADVFVEPAYRRQGVAQQLVAAINAWFAQHGIRHVEWQVAAANTAGINFWDAVGGLAIMVRMRMPIADQGQE